MKLLRMLALGLALGFLPAAGAAQLTEDQVAAAEVALQELIDRNWLPGIDQLSTFRELTSNLPRHKERSDNTDRILQGMGADLVPGRVTSHTCEPATPTRDERTGEMKERWLCRHDDGRRPILFHDITVSDSEAVVVISVEGVAGEPLTYCMPYGGLTFYMRVVRAAGDGWQFDEVFRTLADDMWNECPKGPDPR